MTSKRTAWVQMPRQLRADPELAKRIQEIAAANFRTVQGQILLWVYEGVNRKKVIKSGEFSVRNGKKWHVVSKKERTA